LDAPDSEGAKVLNHLGESLPSEAPERVRDILELEPGLFLLATDGGMKIWRPGDKNFSPPGIPVPSKEVYTLVRDGAGRIWMGGQGLWLLENGRLLAVEGVPHLGFEDVWRLKPHIPDPLAVVVSPGENPSLMVRVE
jgi:ligand-binding sensor domain-containing protein